MPHSTRLRSPLQTGHFSRPVKGSISSTISNSVWRDLCRVVGGAARKQKRRLRHGYTTTGGRDGEGTHLACVGVAGLGTGRADVLGDIVGGFQLLGDLGPACAWEATSELGGVGARAKENQSKMMPALPDKMYL